VVQHSTAGSNQGAFIFSQYGGNSLQNLLGLPWCDSRVNFRTRISKAGDMLACIALALEQLAALPVPRIHRDIKPGNIVFDSASGVYRLIDFGTMIRADKADFFTGFTFAYLEPAMAQSSGSGRFALVTKEGQAAATSAASDIWALCLVALEMMLARLPFELDYEGWYFGGHRKAEFLDALAAWDPWDSTDLSALAMADPAAADLLRRGLARDPAKRLTLQQLLQHPFVKKKVAKFRGVAAELLPRTQKQQQRIRSMLDGVLAAGDAEVSDTAAAADRDEVTMPGTPAAGGTAAAAAAAARSCSAMQQQAAGISSSSSSSDTLSTAACEVAVITSSSSSSRCTTSSHSCSNGSTSNSFVNAAKGVAVARSSSSSGSSCSSGDCSGSDGAAAVGTQQLLSHNTPQKPQPVGCFAGLLGTCFPNQQQQRDSRQLTAAYALADLRHLHQAPRHPAQ
jgi:serine/threonine protein kinase